MVRIALREISGAAPLEETLIELSQLADICLTTVYDHWNAELRQRWGSPESQFAIIGLGKLGGRELNHSSDVDLIFRLQRRGTADRELQLPRMVHPAREQDHRDFRRLRSGWLAFPGRSAAAAGRERRAARPLAREHGKLLRRLWRNVGAARADQSALDLRRPRAGLRFSAPASAVHFSEKSDAGSARRSCRDQDAGSNATSSATRIGSGT